MFIGLCSSDARHVGTPGPEAAGDGHPDHRPPKLLARLPNRREYPAHRRWVSRRKLAEATMRRSVFASTEGALQKRIARHQG